MRSISSKSRQNQSHPHDWLAVSCLEHRNVLFGTQEMSCLGQYRSQKYNIARNHGIMGLKKSSLKNDKFQGVWSVCLELKRFLVFGTHHMPWWEHQECVNWNTRNVLFEAQGMSCFEHKERPGWDTTNVVFRAKRMSCSEHKECRASNIEVT